ncbi:esterase-like activity of phytase family protein [Streptomyces sp. NBC_01549]|uniref:esterase-like activity of phytase family protein n=1 Tax=Streptomyces sp. NBC_01549 TaxID=2975874 RepID=UPI00224D5037|nr:esterase-like activity of phytase family protein [Streptomyces sp. NBC_01549]MCX4591292.1 esterase-like activity of phytase family protein [Streptomyces sp. NBC_01549]
MSLRLLPLTASLLTALVVTAPSAHANPNGERGEYGSSQDAAHACSPRVAIDGFSDTLDKTTFAGVPVAELSGLTRDTNGQLLAVADDSYLFSLDSQTKKPVSVLPLTGAAGQKVDSEAVVVDRDGTRLITDETQPSILRFTRSGHVVDSLPVPDALKVAPAGRATHNLTFEGLAMLPGGHTLVASMEGALSGDGADIRRFQTWQRIGDSDSFRLGPQYAFQSDAGLDISDITSTGDGRLIVLERGYTPNVGNTVRLYLADLRHASDVSLVETVTAGQPGVRLAAKTLLTDIGSCPSLGATAKQAQPNPLLDNIEGVTVTGIDDAGRLELLLVSDDNQRASQTTRLYTLTARLPQR